MQTGRRPFRRCAVRRYPIPLALFVLAVLFVAVSGVRAAELPPQLAIPPETQADEFLKGLANRVVLTPQEVAAVRPILIEQIQKRQDTARARLAANPGMVGMMALREDMRALGKETDARLAEVLPPDKMAVIRAYRDERRQEMRSHLEQARKGG